MIIIKWEIHGIYNSVSNWKRKWLLNDLENRYVTIVPALPYAIYLLCLLFVFVHLSDIRNIVYWDVHIKGGSIIVFYMHNNPNIYKDHVPLWLCLKDYTLNPSSHSCLKEPHHELHSLTTTHTIWHKVLHHALHSGAPGVESGDALSLHVTITRKPDCTWLLCIFYIYILNTFNKRRQ